MNTLQERTKSNADLLAILKKQTGMSLRCAMPGIIENFNASEQTVSVYVAIRELIDTYGNLSWQDIPVLVDVPIVLPRAGGYVLTMPINKGDECLVIFADSCIDGWWQSGGIQNQVEIRRHDLSDGIAIIGLWSQPNVIPGYSMSGAQLRSINGSASITLTDDEIILSADSIKIAAGGNTIIDGKNFLGHVHGGVEPGGGTTGGVS